MGEGAPAGKRKRGDQLAHAPVRRSLREESSLVAHNELLFGCLDGEERALGERKAEYDEARAASEGSDPCWSGSESGVEVEATAVPMI